MNLSVSERMDVVLRDLVLRYDVGLDGWGLYRQPIRERHGDCGADRPRQRYVYAHLHGSRWLSLRHNPHRNGESVDLEYLVDDQDRHDRFDRRSDPSRP